MLIPFSDYEYDYRFAEYERKSKFKSKKAKIYRERIVANSRSSWNEARIKKPEARNVGADPCVCPTIPTCRGQQINSSTGFHPLG